MTNRCSPLLTYRKHLKDVVHPTSEMGVSGGEGWRKNDTKCDISEMELGRLWGHPPTRSRRLSMLSCTFQKKSLLEGFRNLCWNQQGDKTWSLLSGLDYDGFKTVWRFQDRVTVDRLSGDIDSVGFKTFWRHLHVQLSRCETSKSLPPSSWNTHTPILYHVCFCRLFSRVVYGLTICWLVVPLDLQSVDLLSPW